MTPRPVDRRLVLKRLAHGGLVLGGAGLLGALGVLAPGRFARRTAPRDLPDHAVPADPARPTVAVARAGSSAVAPALLVQAALERVGGISRFVRPGETVLLKPNAAWDRTPEQAANTHPAIVAEVVRQCRAAGAKRVVVAEVPVHDVARSLERSGVRRAALEAGAEVVAPPSASFVDVRLGGTALTEWEMLGVLLDADRVINLPIAKDHALSRMTCCFKNWYGLLGGTRARLHQDIHTSIVDLGAAVRPTLTVVDATRVMLRGGPTGGRLDDVITPFAVAAGTDPVALDAWAATLLGIDPATLPHLALAERRGLGHVASVGAGDDIHVGA